jgi:LysR family transcriptional regulator for bpeEF and oprC
VRGDESLTITPPGSLRVNDATADLRAGLEGLGIVRLTTYSAAPYLLSGELEQVLADWRTAPMPVQVVYPQNRHLSAKVRVFVEWVADLFAQQPLLQMQPVQPLQPPQIKRA